VFLIFVWKRGRKNTAASPFNKTVELHLIVEFKFIYILNY
jgi:hypothetical protein